MESNFGEAGFYSAHLAGSMLPLLGVTFKVEIGSMLPIYGSSGLGRQ